MKGGKTIQDDLNKLIPTPREGSMEGYETRAKRKGHKAAVSYLETMIDYVGTLPTPSSRDYKGANVNNPYDCLDSLIEVGATKNQTGQKTGLKLQPAFVEWMMGYPIGWTDLKD
jgi:hypothetical protein